MQESPPLHRGTMGRSSLSLDPPIFHVTADITHQTSTSLLPLGPLHKDTCLIRLELFPVGTWRCMDCVYCSFHLQTMTCHWSASSCSCLLSQSLMTLMDTLHCTAMFSQHWKNVLVMQSEAFCFFSITEVFVISTLRENISMNEHDGGL